MKILKKGIIPSTAKKIICNNCSSELEFNQNDVKHDRDGSYVVCPVCNKFLGLSKQLHISRMED